MALFSMDDPDNEDQMRSIMGPGQVDHQIRNAIQFAWMSLPADRRTVDNVERVVRELVDRALKDFRADGKTFGHGS